MQVGFSNERDSKKCLSKRLHEVNGDDVAAGKALT